MKRKLLCVVLAACLMVSVLTGCSLFTTESGNGTNSESNDSSAIVMTENYTFENPADLQFAKRYVIYADQNSAIVSSAADYGLMAAYSIVYADSEDAPVASYDFLICDSEEHAQSMMDLYESQGMALTATETDPAVLYSVTDGDALEGNLVTYQSMGAISEATVSAYVDFYSGSIGGTIQ